jgi:preprotein translocase subunit SecF
MQWLTGTPNFNFMKYRWAAMIGSSVLTLLAIVAMIGWGFNLGVDFTGGVIVEVQYETAPALEEIRNDLAAAGFASPQVQNFGSTTDVLIRLPPVAENGSIATVQEQVLGILRSHGSGVTLQRLEVVGPQVGEELSEQGGLAMLFALIMVFIYVMLRFRWKFAIGAIIATLHDVIVTAGVFAVLGWPFDLTVLGSLLAVLGYSLNDTIVVYDRIRDNFRLMRRGSPTEIVNASVNQTLARTLVTGVTSLLVLTALMLLGGDTLWGFSVALIIGIVVGTYSSIYVASAAALALKVSPADLVDTKTERVDELP